MIRMSAIIVKNLSKYFIPSKKERRKGKNKSQKLKLENQGKTGIVHAVDNIDFEVKSGEIFGFLGPNGAGKTTTIRILTDVIKPSSGTVKIMGYDVLRQPLRTKQIISVIERNKSGNKHK